MINKYEQLERKLKYDPDELNWDCYQKWRDGFLEPIAEARQEFIQVPDGLDMSIYEVILEYYIPPKFIKVLDYSLSSNFEGEAILTYVRLELGEDYVCDVHLSLDGYNQPCTALNELWEEL